MIDKKKKWCELFVATLFSMMLCIPLLLLGLAGYLIGNLFICTILYTVVNRKYNDEPLFQGRMFK